MKGRLFVISAPAGTGKTTLVNRLKYERPDIVETVSCTTRDRREGETDGEDYHFMTRVEFEKRLAADDFLEHAEVFGQLYGTSAQEVEQLLNQGLNVILVIDTQGALQLKKKVACTTVFLSPPSMEELARRLLSRRTESQEQRETRLKWAEHELKQIPHYDVHIVNDDLETAYHTLNAIIPSV